MAKYIYAAPLKFFEYPDFRKYTGKIYKKVCFRANMCKFFKIFPHSEDDSPWSLTFQDNTLDQEIVNSPCPFKKHWDGCDPLSEHILIFSLVLLTLWSRVASCHQYHLYSQFTQINFLPQWYTCQTNHDTVNSNLLHSFGKRNSALVNWDLR